MEENSDELEEDWGRRMKETIQQVVLPGFTTIIYIKSR
jgi:hypothetical protein